MHVLVISFGYEPLSHVAAKRASRMAAELTRAGDEVTVLTIDWNMPAPDRVRTPEEIVASVVRSESPRVIGIDPRVLTPSFRPDAQPRTTESPSKNGLVSTARRLARRFAWGSFPAWGVLGSRALRALHRERPVDVCWAIHGDDTSHVIASRFSRATGVPWIADYKDPWDIFRSRRGSRWIEERLVRRRLRSASGVTETCEWQGNLDRARFGLPTSVIWSGYAPEVMTALPARRVGDGFAVAYFGHIGSQHDVGRLVDLFRRLRNTRGADVMLHVFTSDDSHVRRAFESAGLGDRIVKHDYVPEAEAFASMRGADVLLLLPSNLRSEKRALVGVKELEYIASGTPVLVLGELLPEVRAILPSGSNVFEAPSNEEAVDFLTSGASARYRREANAEYVARFSWQEQAKTLRRLLAGAAAVSKQRPVREALVN